MRTRFVMAALLAILSLAALYFVFRGSKITRQTCAVQTEVSSPYTGSAAGHQTTVATSSIPQIPNAPLTTNDKKNLGKILEVFKARIDFYGKVQDQHGNPVVGAKVYYSAADQYFGDSSTYEGASGADGLFSITGIKGAGLYVEVSKDGYDRIPNQSYGGFAYGAPSGRQPPTKGDPALFVLRKKADAESLIAVDRDIVVPKDGTLLEVSLTTGKPVPNGQGDLKIECWADDQHRDAQKRYEWRLRLTIPGGGLMERQNTDLDFEAPADGYQAIDEFTMSQSSERWKASFEKQYFAKLGNGTFARMRFRITTGGGHFASITSYLNPNPGDRNLEFDPQKVIKPAR